MIDDNDKVVFGDKDPHTTALFAERFVEWKDSDFSFYLQGIGQVNGYLSDEGSSLLYQRLLGAQGRTSGPLDSLPIPGATYPRMYQSQTHNLLFSDYWLEDASYLRLKNVQLGYSLPKKWLNPCKLEHVRVYVSADNLLTFSNYFGAYDPEVSKPVRAMPIPGQDRHMLD